MSLGKKSLGQNMCEVAALGKTACGTATVDACLLSGFDVGAFGLGEEGNIASGSVIRGSMSSSGDDVSTSRSSKECVLCAEDTERSPRAVFWLLKNLFHKEPFLGGAKGSVESDGLRSDGLLLWYVLAALHVR